jgi:hypothetical protein
MIAELVEYLLTPVAPPLREALRSSIGIRSRHRRLSAEWAPHLAQTRQFLSQTMNRCTGSGLAILLGAGLHHDIPVAALSKRFREVLLVDIVHPAFSAIPLLAHRNVHRIHLDLNGFIHLDPTTGALRSVAALSPSSPLDLLPACDFIASVNVASQLALAAPTTASDPSTNPLTLIQRHLNELREHPSEIKALISDRWIRRSHFGNDQTRATNDDALHGVNLRAPDHHWIWNLAPQGEISQEVSVECEVHAWAQSF